MLWGAAAWPRKSRSLYRYRAPSRHGSLFGEVPGVVLSESVGVGVGVVSESESDCDCECECDNAGTRRRNSVAALRP